MLADESSLVNDQVDGRQRIYKVCRNDVRMSLERLDDDDDGGGLL